MKNSDLVLTWDIDLAEQDGYLYTRSFPLSLGSELEFSEIKKLKVPLVFILPDNNQCIISVSRSKYPGELNSIKENSINTAHFNKIMSAHPFLRNMKVIGFSELYRKIMNVIKGEAHRNMLIRKGVILKLFKTEKEGIYTIKIEDKELSIWRSYSPRKPVVNYVTKKDIDADELKSITKAMRLPLESLIEKIKDVIPERKTVLTHQYSRNPYVIAYALKRSGGICERCGSRHPFVKSNDDFYLEVHHLVPLSNNGSDIPKNVVALCPNCHRLLHHGKERVAETDRLAKKFSI